MHFCFVPTTVSFFFLFKTCKLDFSQIWKKHKRTLKGLFHFSWFLFGSVFWSTKMGWANSRDFNSFFQPTIWAMSNESPSWLTERIGQGVGWIRARSTMTNVFNNFRRKMVLKIGTTKRSPYGRRRCCRH